MVTGGGFGCRGCGSGRLDQVVDLGAQPAADHFPLTTDPGPDPRWPLELWFCRSCTLAQLGPAKVTEPQATEIAVESATSLAHAADSVGELLRGHPELDGAVVAEFASHHGGSWLGHLEAAGCRVAAVGEPAELVLDVHGLAHEPDLGSEIGIRAERLAPDGLMVMEFHHLLPLVAGNQFDTIRHGHWSYLSLGAVQRIAGQAGLTVVSARPVDMFGGSVQVELRHSAPGVRPDAGVAEVLAAEAAAGLDEPGRLSTLHDTARKCAAALRETLAAHAEAGRRVLGYGAPSKAPVLLDLSGVDAELLPFTVDKSPAKHGRRIPGTAVPIRPVEELAAAGPDVVLVLTWDIAAEVISELESDGGWGASYLVPLPEPHVVAR